MYQHSSEAMATRQGSTWDLDETAESHGWTGVGIGLGQNRDSDAIDRSNWDVVVTELNQRFPDETPTPWSIARLGHWAVGWVEYLIYNTGNPEVVEYFETIKTKLSDYPLLDESHHSDLVESEMHPDDGYCYCTADESCGCGGDDCGCGRKSGFDLRT